MTQEELKKRLLHSLSPEERKELAEYARRKLEHPEEINAMTKQCADSFCAFRDVLRNRNLTS